MSTSKRVTITDVARQAGVSIKTVSNVINNSGSMRPETRERVRKTITSMGYSVNYSARSLKTGVSKLIGLATFDFTQSFTALFAQSLIEVARERDYGVVINTYDLDGTGLPEAVDRIPSLGADGWIFLSGKPLANEGAILQQQYPIVFVGDFDAYGKADSVRVPSREAMDALVSRLLAKGFRRIGLIGAPEGVDANNVMQASEGAGPLRLRGFVEAFSRLGIPVDWNLVIPESRWLSSDGERAIRDLLGRVACPEIIICLNDALAFGAVHELQRMGLQIPQDVQVIGFDNVQECQFSTPTLSTVDLHMEAFASAAVDMLIGRINGDTGPFQTVTTDFTFVERASTRALR
ncbi:LacI family DNA-binding transcriptional regulator [Bifidobacterium olomucense]|uniref:LacI family transcriptional regulator n=1 Tax=Bifidobacterium olomucense TaxID=2675324 RepID=A0A7Y0EZA2_9BIFI|nr:LacI family DNA-binding transcriptional regulator [Bifidobacterium sp. DSM 109959]NMM99142.1 LacI family transcriptional regulator [Bifidobacterium sp. DSM 109959]